MITSPARSRVRGSGPPPRCVGVTAVEALTALGIAATLLAVVAPGVAQLQSSVAVRSAASETAIAFSLARAMPSATAPMWA